LPPGVCGRPQPFFRMIAAATTVSQFILLEDDHNPMWFTSPNQVLKFQPQA
jgi:hypothetical protein